MADPAASSTPTPADVAAADAAAKAAAANPEGSKETPWGDDFDAARAWTLVTNVKAERDKFKSDLAALTAAQEAAADSTKTDAEKLAARIEAAEARAKDAEHKLTLANVLRDFPELADFADLLTGDDEAAIRGKAERLAAIGKPDKPDADAEAAAKAAAAAVAGKPQPDLVPGHGGDHKEAFDPDAIAKAARAQRW